LSKSLTCAGIVALVRKLPSPRRAFLACAPLALLAAAGCGTTRTGAGVKTETTAHPAIRAHTATRAHTGVRTPVSLSGASASSCTTPVLGALDDIAKRIYHEGVASERTGSAISYVEHSSRLRKAIERNDPRAARAATRALLATGHLTDLRVVRDPAASAGGGGAASRGHVLVNVTSPAAVAPLHGRILGASGQPIATFTTSVWADQSLIDEIDGLTQSHTVLREPGRTVAGSPKLLSAEPHAPQGTLTVHKVKYAYTSFPASSYPEGRPLRIYLLRSLASIAPLCAASRTATLVNTLKSVAQIIYSGERGPRALVQVRRAQSNRPLLRAVAARDPHATTLAIDKLLTQHIVRIRVTVHGHLLADVGGPYVIAPVSAPLRLHGRTIGTMTLSIQDDEGYKRLAQRLAGLEVLMYMQAAGSSAPAQLVKSTFSPPPSAVPARGPYEYEGRSFQTFTLHAQAFPSGPLRVVLLIPTPYTYK
jgi:hypothetical protein